MGTTCRTPLTSLVAAVKKMAPYKVWYTANFTKCYAAISKFRAGAVCAACDPAQGDKFTAGMKLKSMMPMITPCVPVFHFQQHFIQPVLDSLVGFAGAAHVSAPGIHDFKRYWTVNLDKCASVSAKPKVKIAIKKRILQTIIPTRELQKKKKPAKKAKKAKKPKKAKKAKKGKKGAKLKVKAKGKKPKSKLKVKVGGKAKLKVKKPKMRLKIKGKKPKAHGKLKLKIKGKKPKAH